MHDHHVLLAEYTLGLLDGHETAEAHALLGQDTEAVKTALNWENDLLELVDLLPPVHPSWQVLQRIQSDLGHQPAPAPSSLYRKPASDDTSLAASIAETARAPEAARTSARRASSARSGSSSGSVQRRATAHTEPYFSAPPDLPGSSEVPAAGTPQTATTVPAPAPIGAYGTTASSSVSSAPPATPNAQVEPAALPDSSATLVSEPLASSPSPEAAGSSVHVMGERDARRVERTTTDRPVKEKQKTPPPREETHKGAKAVTGNIWVWRGATMAIGLIALALAFIPSKPVEPPVTIVQVAPTQAAILQAPGQSSTPGWIVTIDAQRNVLLNPQVRSDIPSDAAVQLWTRSKTMPQPRSLGLIDPNQPVTVPAALMGEISPDQLFEMTQEPIGGSPTAGPSGPVLFIGRLVTFGKPAPAVPQGEAASVKPAAG